MKGHKRHCRLFLKVLTFSPAITNLTRFSLQMSHQFFFCPYFTCFLCSIFSETPFYNLPFQKVSTCDVIKGSGTFYRSVASLKGRYWHSEHFSPTTHYDTILNLDDKSNFRNNKKSEGFPARLSFLKT